MIQNGQHKNTEKKRFRGEVTAEQMDQFLSRPIPKIQNLNRSLRKSYESGFFKKQKFDQLRELKKIQDNDQQNNSQNDNQDDSVFTIHNDKRSRRKRQRQKKLALKGSREDKKDNVGLIKIYQKKQAEVKNQIQQTKGQEQSKKEESSSSGQSGDGSASQSQSGSQNESSSSQSQSQSKQGAVQERNQNTNNLNAENNPVISNPSIEQPVNSVKQQLNQQRTQQKFTQNNVIDTIKHSEGQQSGQEVRLAKNKVQQQQCVKQPRIKVQPNQNNISKRQYPKINNLQSQDQQTKLRKIAQANSANIQKKTRSKIKIGRSIDSGQPSQVKNNKSDNKQRSAKNKPKLRNQAQSEKSDHQGKQKSEDQDPYKNPKRFIDYRVEAKRRFHNLSFCSKVVIQSIFIRVPHYFYAYSPREAELLASHGIQTSHLNQNYLIAQGHEKIFPIGSFRRKKIVETQQLYDRQEIREQQSVKDKDSQKQDEVSVEITQKNRKRGKKEATIQKSRQNTRIKRVPRELQLLLDSRPSSDRRRIRPINREQIGQAKDEDKNNLLEVGEEQNQQQIAQQIQLNQIDNRDQQIQKQSVQKVKQKKKNRKNKHRHNKQE